MKQKVLLDSGAFSAWQQKKGVVLQKYIDFIKENLDIIETYANLDDIENPEKTWENQVEMERQGLNPLPVYHVGEDPKYLTRCMEDYEYFAVGGMALKGANIREMHFDLIFSKVCPKSNGYKPTHKVHGFGLSSPNLMMLYPWFSVDSITEDSVLLLRDCGRVRIETIGSFYNSCREYGSVVKTSTYGHQYKELDNVETYTVDKNGLGKWCKVTKVIRHEVGKNIFDIFTNYGHHVSVTKDHSCYIIRNNEKICIPTEQINNSDKIIKVNYSDNFRDLKELVVEIEIASYQKTNAKNSNRNKVKRPRKIEFSKEFLEFCGLWVADGHYHLGGKEKEMIAVGISAANDKECLNLTRKISNQYNRELIEKSNGVDSTINSKELTNIMKELGLSTGSHEKEIPWWVFDLSRENLCSFLRGYFSGDGSVSESVEYSSVSISLLYGIHFLLNKLGVYPMINESRETPSGSINDLGGKKIFFDEIGFLQQYKNEKLRNILLDKISRGKLAKVINQEMHLRHRGVIKNKAKKVMVYDLEVPEEQSFLANGILVHNSTSWVMYGKYGLILVPRRTMGVFDYKLPPQVMSVSARSKGLGKDSHYARHSPMEKEIILKYCENLGFQMGHSDIIDVDPNHKLVSDEKWIVKGQKIEKIIEVGLCNDGELRDQFNLLFFLEMEKCQPSWPWAWNKTNRKGLF